MNHDIVTLTINPSLDKSTKFSGLTADQKIRCDTPNYDAGGGGINVSKAISRLGGESLCVFTSGGPSGSMIESLLAKEAIQIQAIPVQKWTRENMIAVDTSANKQYRFGFPGAELSDDEVQLIKSTIQRLKPKFLIASGSLNEGLSSDFYNNLAISAANSGTKFIADTSGKALRQVLDAGVYLAKPNVGELAKLIGVKKLEVDEADDAARTLIDNGNAEIVVVSLGPQGAVLVTKNEKFMFLLRMS
ncbi:MAG TPA: PfkB family carbohydrate kinase [Flavobacterium sp.]|jgi:6-phosphofructokinase 2